MIMYQFMVDSFYTLCGVLCITVSFVIVYVVAIGVFRTIRKGMGKNGRN